MGVLEDMLKALDRIPGWKRLQELPSEVEFKRLRRPMDAPEIQQRADEAFALVAKLEELASTFPAIPISDPDPTESGSSCPHIPRHP